MFMELVYVEFYHIQKHKQLLDFTYFIKVNKHEVPEHEDMLCWNPLVLIFYILITFDMYLSTRECDSY